MSGLPVLLDGETVGNLSGTEEGLYVRFEAVCRFSAQEPLRLIAVGERGELRLGVPEPENGRWFLRRRISAREAAAAGKLLRGELRPTASPEKWERAAAPESLFRSAFLRGQLRGAEGVLTRPGDGVRFVALPYDGRRPFLLTGLFCFATVQRIGGRSYAVFCFDRDENPIFRA